MFSSAGGFENPIGPGRYGRCAHNATSHKRYNRVRPGSLGGRSFAGIGVKMSRVQAQAVRTARAASRPDSQYISEPCLAT